MVHFYQYLRYGSGQLPVEIDTFFVFYLRKPSRTVHDLACGYSLDRITLLTYRFKFELDAVLCYNSLLNNPKENYNDFY